MTADIQLIRRLLRIAHEVNPPETCDDWNDQLFEHPSGWKVIIFYDAGDLDYIDAFVSPEGVRIDLWGETIDPRVCDINDDGWLSSTLQCWRGVDDTERLIKLLEGTGTPRSMVIGDIFHAEYIADLCVKRVATLVGTSYNDSVRFHTGGILVPPEPKPLSEGIVGCTGSGRPVYDGEWFDRKMQEPGLSISVTVNPNHILTVEPQPIADQVVAKCSCGWREAVSIYEIHDGGPTMANIATAKHEAHLRATDDALGIDR